MTCDYEKYVRSGGLLGGMPKARQEALLQAHQAHHATTCRTRCGVCGAEACARPECFRAMLTAEEERIVRQRLAQHAAGAERDARTRQNGGAPR